MEERRQKARHIRRASLGRLSKHKNTSSDPQSSGLASTELWFMSVCCPTLDRELNTHTTNYTQLQPSSADLKPHSSSWIYPSSAPYSVYIGSVHIKMETNDDWFEMLFIGNNQS